MKHALLDTTRVIRNVEINGTTYEVCAEAIANHDRISNQVTVTLRAFLRATEHTHLGEMTTPSWLPTTQTVTEHVGVEEAHDMANDIFATWCHKLAKATP